MRHLTCLLFKPWVLLSRELNREHLSPDPITQFDRWYKQLMYFFWLEFPDAMCLSTISEDGFPEGRLVLLKHFDSQGFVFYTNSNSNKGRALAKVPKAALTFYWDLLQRQVRIQGTVSQVSEKESDQYFKSRPRRSQIAAWASSQSEVISSRSDLELKVKEYEKKFDGTEIPRPPHWNGYRVVPFRMEFWKLRFNRMHDRFVYCSNEDGSWTMNRLQP